jgi:hypothetical protein
MLQLSERKEKRRNVINAPRMRRGEQAYVGVIDNPSTRCRRPQKRAGPWLTFLRMPGVNRQGQAHIVSTAIPLPRSGKAGREVEATPWLRTRFSIDPQPASISPTINISIVFICAFLVDCGRIICHPATKNDSNAILRSVLLASSTG